MSFNQRKVPSLMPVWSAAPETIQTGRREITSGMRPEDVEQSCLIGACERLLSCLTDRTRQDMLAIASFIIRCHGLASQARHVGHLSAMATIRPSGLPPRNAPSGIPRPWALALLIWNHGRDCFRPTTAFRPPETNPTTPWRTKRHMSCRPLSRAHSRWSSLRQHRSEPRS